MCTGRWWRCPSFSPSFSSNLLQSTFWTRSTLLLTSLTHRYTYIHTSFARGVDTPYTTHTHTCTHRSSSPIPTHPFFMGWALNQICVLPSLFSFPHFHGVGIKSKLCSPFPFLSQIFPLFPFLPIHTLLSLSLPLQNIGQMLRSHFRSSQFIVVSLKDGMFNNANVLFKTKFVDGVSTVTRLRAS